MAIPKSQMGNKVVYHHIIISRDILLYKTTTLLSSFRILFTKPGIPFNGLNDLPYFQKIWES